MTSKEQGKSLVFDDSTFKSVGLIENNDNMYIQVDGNTKHLYLDCDGDSSYIHIGNRTTNSYSKTIYLGNYGSTALGYGSNITMSAKQLNITTGDKIQIDGAYISCNDIKPNGDNAKAFGSSILRWASIYGMNGYLSTSLTTPIIYPSSIVGTEVLNNTDYSAQFGVDSYETITCDFPTLTSIKILNGIGTAYSTITQTAYIPAIVGCIKETTNRTYKFVYTISNYTGSMTATLSGLFSNIVLDITNGTHTIDIVVNDTSEAFILSLTDITSSSGIIISNLSLKPYIDDLQIRGGIKNTGSSSTSLSFSDDGTTFSKSIIPATNSEYNLGSSSKFFDKLYVNQIIQEGETLESQIMTQLSTPSIISASHMTIEPNGNLTVGKLNYSIYSKSSIIPSSGYVCDLGSASDPFSTIYTHTLENVGNLSIKATGASTTLNIDNDNDNSIINIGYYNGSTTNQLKTINIGDILDTSINIYGTITSDLKISRTTSSTVKSDIYNGKTTGGVCYFDVGAYAGGVLRMIANSSGTSQFGIPNGSCGISATYTDLYIATGTNGGANATTRLQLTSNLTGDNYLYSSVHLYPKTGSTYDIGGSGANRWNSIYTTNGNISTLTSGTITNTASMQITTSAGNIQLSPYGYIEITKNLLPSAVDTVDIGSSDVHFDNMYANAFNTMSDKRLKTNIRPLNKGLEFINKIEPVEFNYISNKKKDVFGFIAQDVEKELNENHSLIKKPETEKSFYSIEYSQFIPIIIKSIQDLYSLLKIGGVNVENKSMVDDLDIMKNNIELLTSEITKIKKDIKKIKS